MTMTDEQRKAFALASEPLMWWLSENCHPHTRHPRLYAGRACRGRRRARY